MACLSRTSSSRLVHSWNALASQDRWICSARLPVQEKRTVTINRMNAMAGAESEAGGNDRGRAAESRRGDGALTWCLSINMAEQPQQLLKLVDVNRLLFSTSNTTLQTSSRCLSSVSDHFSSCCKASRQALRLHLLRMHLRLSPAQQASKFAIQPKVSAARRRAGVRFASLKS